MSKRFNTTIASLMSANPRVNPLNLQIGQKIRVPEQQIDPVCQEGYYYPIPPRDTIELPPTKQLPVFIEGKTDYRQAHLQKSDQGYYIYVLDNYQFTAEEPGSDVLFSTNNDSFFVRIQRLPSESNLSDLRQNMILSLSFINVYPKTCAIVLLFVEHGSHRLDVSGVRIKRQIENSYDLIKPKVRKRI